MNTFVEVDKHVTIADQLEEEGGPVILINTFTVEPEDADAFLLAWTDDGNIMKRQPGFISGQLHRGIAGSGVFLNYAVWQTVGHFARAFANPEFRDSSTTTRRAPSARRTFSARLRSTTFASLKYRGWSCLAEGSDANTASLWRVINAPRLSSHLPTTPPKLRFAPTWNSCL